MGFGGVKFRGKLFKDIQVEINATMQGGQT